jgi:hypothetical protein
MPSTRPPRALERLREEREVPVQAVRQADRPVREPVRDLELDATAVEAADDDSAAFGAEVDGCEGAPASRGGTPPRAA